MDTSKAVPFKWPFPPPQNRAPASRSKPVSCLLQGHTRKGMLADVVMVVFWGASIPGFMWLGAICGF